MRTNKKQAFTMVELLVVLVILGILFVVLMANVDFTTEEAKSTGAMNLLHSYQTAAKTVGLQYTGFTNDMTELVYQLNKKLDPELQVFLVGNEIYTNAEDPWGTTIKIEYSEPVDSKGQIKFASAGADTVFDTGDDIITLLRCNMENEIVIENPVNDPNHTHEYTQEIPNTEFLYSEANCQSVARYYRSCMCGAKGDTTFEAGAKNFDKHAATIDAFIPYDEESHKFTRTCSACASVIQQSYELHQVQDGVQCILCGDLTHRHEYTRELQLPEYKKNDATCSAPLTYFKSCSCGQKGTATFTVGTARDHDFSKRTLDYFVSGATCASPAKYYLTCAYCDAKGTETYTYGNRDESNHIGGEIIQYENIDDTKHTKKVICMGCGYPKSETTENHFEGCGCHTHQYTEEVVMTDYLKTAATCTGKAVYYTSCNCGRSSQDTADENTFETGAVLGHAPASTPTWNTDHSIATVKCTRCTKTWSGNSSKNVTTTPNCTTDEKFSHDVTINVNGTNKSFNCGTSHTGSKATGTHTGSAINGGTAGVHTKYSCCGATISSTHNYTAATCTAPKTCSCGYSTGSALGHSPATSATWDTNHTKATVKCTRSGCSQTWSSTSVSEVTTTTATCMQVRIYKHKVTINVNGTNKTFECSGGHTGSKNASNHSGSKTNVGTSSICTKWSCCGVTASSTHDYGNATCTTAAKCSICGYSTGSALGHNYTVVVTAPTCTTTGTNKCSRCTATTTVAELGHTPGAAATCTTAQKCTVCNATIANAKGHNYQTKTAADCLNAEVEKCSRCTSTRTGDPALGHNSVNGGTSDVHTKCSRCNKTLSSTHSFTNTKTASVCRSCACGYKETSHVYGSGTCTVAASCTVCGYSSGTAPGHDYTSWTALGSDTHVRGCSRCTLAEKENCTFTYKTNDLVSSATCTSPAKYAYECTKCYNRNGNTYTSGNALGHSPNSDDGNCTTAITCSRCGVVTTSAKTHNWSTSWSSHTSTTHKRGCNNSGCNSIDTASCTFTYKTTDVATYATCQAAATFYYECQHCTNRDGSTYSSGNKAAHDFDEYIQATCTSAATEKCTKCGTTQAGEAAWGHNWTTQTAATCSSAEVEKCSRCSATRTGDPANGNHSYGSYSAYGSTTHRRTCNNCSASQTENCSFTYKSGDLASSATCTSAARYYLECSTCTNQSGTYSSGGGPLGHNMMQTKAATCTKSGTETCQRPLCGHTETIPPLGHDPVYSGTASVHTKCSTCGTTLSTTHSYSVTTAPTCARQGKETCACGYSRTIAKSTTHSGPFEDTDTSTCTTGGEIRNKCTLCGTVTGILIGSPLGHNFTSSGTCSRCGASCSHDYEPTYAVPAAGGKHRQYYSCTICGHSKNQMGVCRYQLEAGTGTGVCPTCGNTSSNSLN